MSKVEGMEQWLKDYAEYGPEFMTNDDLFNGLYWALQSLQELQERIRKLEGKRTKQVPE